MCLRQPTEKKVIPFGFEPKTYCLEGSCSIQLSYGTNSCRNKKDRQACLQVKAFGIGFRKERCRGGKIRTCDLLVPNQAR